MEDLHKNVKQYDKDKLAWKAEVTPETERVYDPQTDTWSNRPIKPPQKVAKKKAKK